MRDVAGVDLYRDVLNHICSSDRVIVARDGDVPVAYLAPSLKCIDKGLLYHLEGMIVDPGYQGSGLAYNMLKDEVKTTSDVT